MANKKISQLTSKPSVLTTDLFPIADPTTGQLFKTTISDLGTAIGSGVSSVNTLVGAVVLDTDDIQELVSPTNKWYTDTRSRAAISAGTGISYNSGTGVITNAVTSGQIATALGYTPANGANYLPLAGGTMGGAIFGTIATFESSTSVTALGITLSGASGDGVKITHSAGRAFNIQSSGSGFGILINNETAATSAPFTIQKQGSSVITLTDAGAGSFASSLTASSFVKSGGTSSQFLKADGSVDSTSYQPTLTNPVTGTGTSGIVAVFNGTSSITDSSIYANSTRVSIGADVTTSNKFTAVASTSSSYAVVAQASGAANGFWATLSGTGEIFRGQTSGGSYFIINNGGNAFLNGNLNIGDFASTSYKLNVVGTANFTGALSGTTITTTGNNIFNNTSGRGVDSVSTGVLFAQNGGSHNIIFGDGNVRYYSLFTPSGAAYGSIRNFSTSSDILSFTSSGNVGIGTTAPNDYSIGSTAKVLQVTGSAYGIVNANAGSVYAWLIADTTAAATGTQSNHDFKIVTNNTERMRITSVGAVQIGTRSDATESTANLALNNTNYGGFHFLDGTAYYIGQNSNFRSLRMYSGGSTGTGVNLAAGATSWGTYSDERMKTDLMPIENATEKVSQLRSVIGRYKTDEQSKKRSFLIAQDVKEVLPEAISEDLQTGMLEIRYTEVIPLLVASIKELKAELDALKA